jgi:catalase
MKDDNIRGISRRKMLSSTGKLSLLGVVAPAATAAATRMDYKAEAIAPIPPVADMSQNPIDDTTGRELVYSLEQAYGVHKGQRRNHTKGVGARGSFIGNPEMSRYSCSELFSGEKIDVVARFSIAGGNPHVVDSDPSPRGMALEFRLPNGALQHMTMLHTPMFFAVVPKTFFDKFVALTPDPATGKPNPERFKAWMQTHPDATAQDDFLAQYPPPPSYANSAYFSIHTFKFVDSKGDVTMVRWRFEPHDGVKHILEAAVNDKEDGFLQSALIERAKQGPILWDMIVTIGQPGDPVDNATVLYPKDRVEVKAGTLSLDYAAPQEEAGSYGINFDPLVLAKGIEATDDPILQARSSSYGVSYSRRLRGI